MSFSQHYHDESKRRKWQNPEKILERIGLHGGQTFVDMGCDKGAEVRSIQEHDDDFDWSAKGDRVGLALKEVEVADLDRGMVLTNNASVKSTLAIATEARLVKYWPAPLKEGMVLHIGHWMQFANARVESVSDEGDWRQPTLRLALDKALVHLPGARAIICYLDGGKLRVVGILDFP